MLPLGIFPGKIDVEVTSADREGLLQRAGVAGITVFRVEDIGQMDLRFQVEKKDLDKLLEVSCSHGDSLRVLRGRGLYRIVSKCFHRPVLMFGILLLLFLTVYLPSKVLLVEVEGAVKVSKRLILSEASVCGLRCGMARRDVRSEQVKNSLLRSVPGLQWIGVNTYGCRAVISVKERTTGDRVDRPKGVGHVVSLRDGVVTEITVTKGTALCAPGEAVVDGQVLISGYSDRGLFVRGEIAEGDVFGRTERSVTSFLPEKAVYRTGVKRSEKNLCLILGKKRVFFSKGSGISDSSCGKIYTEHYVTLPGNVRVPIGIGIEEITYPQTEERCIPPEEAGAILESRTEDHLLHQMTSGRILSREVSGSSVDGAYVLSGRYHCHEMIGIIYIEENLERYEAADRTGRERRES